MNNLIQSKKQIEKLKLLAEKQLETDEKFMREAIKQAKLALKNGDVPVGAVIVKNGEIIARAYNKKEKDDCALCHAEILAIKKASKKLGWRLDGCDIYVTLEPCAMCAGAIASARLNRAVFGAKEPKSGFCVSRGNLLESCGLNHKTAAVCGVLEEDCAKMIKDLFDKRRKTQAKPERNGEN